MQKKFYVYVHRYASGPKAGRVFYVGKGSGRRAWNKTHRSEYWIRIYKKYGRSVSIFAKFHMETCALSIEASLIKKIGLQNLCNLNNGGLGCSGITEENRLQKSDLFSGSKNPAFDNTTYVFWHPSYGKVTCNKLNLRLVFGVQSSALARVCNGKSKSICGWMLHAKKGEKIGKAGPNRKTKMTIETYIHSSGMVWTGNPFDFRSEFGLNKTNVYKMRTGRQSPYKGWRVAP